MSLFAFLKQNPEFFWHKCNERKLTENKRHLAETKGPKNLLEKSVQRIVDFLCDRPNLVKALSNKTLEEYCDENRYTGEQLLGPIQDIPGFSNITEQTLHAIQDSIINPWYEAQISNALENIQREKKSESLSFSSDLNDHIDTLIHNCNQLNQQTNERLTFIAGETKYHPRPIDEKAYIETLKSTLVKLIGLLKSGLASYISLENIEVLHENTKKIIDTPFFRQDEEYKKKRDLLEQEYKRNNRFSKHMFELLESIVVNDARHKPKNYNIVFKEFELSFIKRPEVKAEQSKNIQNEKKAIAISADDLIAYQRSEKDLESSIDDLKDSSVSSAFWACVDESLELEPVILDSYGLMKKIDALHLSIFKVASLATQSIERSINIGNQFNIRNPERVEDNLGYQKLCQLRSAFGFCEEIEQRLVLAEQLKNIAVQDLHRYYNKNNNICDCGTMFPCDCLTQIFVSVPIYDSSRIKALVQFIRSLGTSKNPPSLLEIQKNIQILDQSIRNESIFYKKALFYPKSMSAVDKIKKVFAPYQPKLTFIEQLTKMAEDDLARYKKKNKVTERVFNSRVDALSTFIKNIKTANPNNGDFIFKQIELLESSVKNEYFSHRQNFKNVKNDSLNVVDKMRKLTKSRNINSLASTFKDMAEKDLARYKAKNRIQTNARIEALNSLVTSCNSNNANIEANIQKLESTIKGEYLFFRYRHIDNESLKMVKRMYELYEIYKKDIRPANLLEL